MVFDFKKYSLGNGGGMWDVIINAATIGLHLVCATFIGLAIGYYLEGWLCEKFDLCWKPWIMIFWLLSGIGAGFKNMYMEVQRIQRAQEKQNASKQKEEDKGKNAEDRKPEN